MGKIIFHIPYEKMITINYLFKKDEKKNALMTLFIK